VISHRSPGSIQPPGSARCGIYPRDKYRNRWFRQWTRHDQRSPGVAARSLLCAPTVSARNRSGLESSTRRRRSPTSWRPLRFDAVAPSPVPGELPRPRDGTSLRQDTTSSLDRADDPDSPRRSAQERRVEPPAGQATFNHHVALIRPRRLQLRPRTATPVHVRASKPFAPAPPRSRKDTRVIPDGYARPPPRTDRPTGADLYKAA